VRPNVRAKVVSTVWRAGTAAQNWGEAPAPQAQCATPLGLSLSEGLGRTGQTTSEDYFCLVLRVEVGDAPAVLVASSRVEASSSC
jgi:hypothetical protein